jgi:hypothetical protein
MPQSYELHINSFIDRKPTDLYTTNFTTYFSNPIKTNNGKVKLNVKNIEIPNIFYTFGESEYILYVIIDPSGVPTTKSYTLSLTRNYADGATIATALNSLCALDNIVFTFDSTTARLTCTNNNASSIRIIGSYRYSDNLSTAFSNVVDRLGFTQNMTSQTIISTGSLEAESPLRLLRSNCYYLTCDIISSYTNQSRVPNPYTKPYIFARVSANNFGYLSQYIYSNDFMLNTTETIIEKMTFQLLDDQLFEINATNCPITFTIGVTID